VVRQVTEEEKRLLRESAAHYAEKAQRYSAELVRI
jgi:carbonic anhydrase/acetyltransferase-like protein (isoleucine patch superfamily)